MKAVFSRSKEHEARILAHQQRVQSDLAVLGKRASCRQNEKVCHKCGTTSYEQPSSLRHKGWILRREFYGYRSDFVLVWTCGECKGK